jgi:hypothetical protein
MRIFVYCVNAIDNNYFFSNEEVLLIGTIAVGFTKMVDNITNTKAKIHAQHHSHHEKKSLVFTYLFYNLPAIFANKSQIRPSDIRRHLPDVWKTIQSADLTDILNSFVRIGILKKVERQIKSQKPGHPTACDSLTDERGTKSFYRSSDYYNDLKNILNKLQHVNLIYTLISKSGLLFKFLKHTNFVTYQIIKNKDKKTAWNILQTSNLTAIKKESDFEADYNMLRNVDDGKLEGMAIKKAESFIINHKAVDYKDLYLTAGFFFRV